MLVEKNLYKYKSLDFENYGIKEFIDSFQDVSGVKNIVSKEKALKEFNMFLTDIGKSLIKHYEVSFKNQFSYAKQKLDSFVLLFINL